MVDIPTDLLKALENLARGDRATLSQEMEAASREKVKEVLPQILKSSKDFWGIWFTLEWKFSARLTPVEAYQLLKECLPEILKNSEDFANIWRILDDEARKLFIVDFKPENYISNRSDLELIVGTISWAGIFPDVPKRLIEDKLSAVMNSFDDFIAIQDWCKSRRIPFTQNKACFEILKNKIPEIVKTNEELIVVLRKLTQEQRVEICARAAISLPITTQETAHFKAVFKVLDKQSRIQLLKNGSMMKRIVTVQGFADTVTYLLNSKVIGRECEPYLFDISDELMRDFDVQYGSLYSILKKKTPKERSIIFAPFLRKSLLEPDKFIRIIEQHFGDRAYEVLRRVITQPVWSALTKKQQDSLLGSYFGDNISILISTFPPEAEKPAQPPEAAKPSQPPEAPKPSPKTEAAKPSQPPEAPKPSPKTDAAKPSQPPEAPKPSPKPKPAKPSPKTNAVEKLEPRAHNADPKKRQEILSSVKSMLIEYRNHLQSESRTKKDKQRFFPELHACKKIEVVSEAIDIINNGEGCHHEDILRRVINKLKEGKINHRSTTGKIGSRWTTTGFKLIMDIEKLEPRRPK